MNDSSKKNNQPDTLISFRDAKRVLLIIPSTTLIGLGLVLSANAGAENIDFSNGTIVGGAVVGGVGLVASAVALRLLHRRQSAVTQQASPAQGPGA